MYYEMCYGVICIHNTGYSSMPNVSPWHYVDNHTFDDTDTSDVWKRKYIAIGIHPQIISLSSQLIIN